MSAHDDLVTTATVGLARRPLPARDAAGTPADDAGALLELAARDAVARRAGVLVPRGIAVPPPMPPDPGPELPPRAAQVLGRVIADHELLADLLGWAARAGYRAPAPLLPGLLDAAARTVALRPALAATLGTRGRWLAAHRAEWKRIVAADSAGPALDDPRAWETGTRAERMGYLASLRDRDPVAARELLAAGWARENARDREYLLPVLARNLVASDEGFLEAALDDGAPAVRIAARRLLGRLPGSAFNRRAVHRAAHVLRLRSDGGHRWLEVAAANPADLPERADIQRDGIATANPLGQELTGGRAALVTRLIAAVPLAQWSARWGLSAAEIMTLDIRDCAPAHPVEPGSRDGSLVTALIAGWRLAAASQSSAEWAKAILAGPAPLLAPDRQASEWPPNHVLAGLLDPATRTELTRDVFTRISAEGRGPQKGVRGTQRTADGDAIAELAAWPGPWPQDAADFVMDMVISRITARGTVRDLQALLASATRRVPVTSPRDYAAELVQLTYRPDGYPWRGVLSRAADTITLRRAFAQALSPASSVS